MNAPTPYWFKAKRYGWGWGLPATWQGWVFFVVWLLCLAVAARHFMPRRPLAFVASSTVLALLLLLVCVVKGEPPSWRWGERDSR